MRVMVYNILNGGGRDRLKFVTDVASAEEPDVLGLLECRGFDDNGGARLFEVEEATGLRGFLAPSTSGQAVTLFLNPEWQPKAVYRYASPVFHHACLCAHVQSTDGTPFTFVLTHLNPFSPDARLIEAQHMLRGVKDTANAIVMGDFNTYSHQDELTHDVLLDITPIRKPRQGGDRLDTRVTRTLTAAGLVDTFRHLFSDPARVKGFTAPTALADAADSHTQARIDYLFATAPMVERLTACRIPQPFHADRASDHYPLVADFKDDGGDPDAAS